MIKTTPRMNSELGKVTLCRLGALRSGKPPEWEVSALDFLDLDDLDSVTDVCFDFVTDPSPRRGQRVAIIELQDTAPHVIDVLESMVLDGIEDRTEVAHYVQYVFGS